MNKFTPMKSSVQNISWNIDSSYFVVPDLVVNKKSKFGVELFGKLVKKVRPNKANDIEFIVDVENQKNCYDFVAAQHSNMDAIFSGPTINKIQEVGEDELAKNQEITKLKKQAEHSKKSINIDKTFTEKDFFAEEDPRFMRATF